MAGAFYRAGEHALMLRTCSRFTPGADSSILFNKPLEQINVLIVQRVNLLRAETADARSSGKPAPSAAALRASSARIGGI